MHFGIVFARFTQNLHHFAFHAARFGGILRDSHQHFVVGFGFFELGAGNKNVVVESFAGGRHKAIIRPNIHQAHDFGLAAFHHFLHAPLAAAVAARIAKNSNAHRVPVQGRIQIVGVNPNVVGLAVYNDKTKVFIGVFEATNQHISVFIGLIQPFFAATHALFLQQFVH